MSFLSGLRPWIAATIWILATAAQASAATAFDRWNQLSQREKTFLQMVFEGDDARAAEYVRVSGINPDSIGGEPLSVWFYRMGGTGRGALYQINAQRIVFERYRQNPNPQKIGPNNLEKFCAFAPVPQELMIQLGGMSTDARAAGPQWEALNRTIREKQRPYVQAMAERFTSLVRYGLHDKAIVTAIFSACVGNRPFTLTPELYDLLISPMIRAGADINRPLADGRRPVEMFVRAVDAPMVSRLARDGAQLNFMVKGLGCSKPSNLYVYLMNNLKPADQRPYLEIVKLLSAAGVSPMKPIDYGGYQCRHASLYDAVLDSGNLGYAAAIKSAAEPTSPVEHTAKSAGQAQSPTAGAMEQQIGQWRIVTQDGRLTAIAKAENAVKVGGDNIAGLWLECAPGGRLEYVAISLAGMFKEIRTLWINSAGDVYTIPLRKGRASGAAAVDISKRLLAEEAASDGDWTMQMSIMSENGPMSNLELGGFSKVRSFMLANCKQ